MRSHEMRSVGRGKNALSNSGDGSKEGRRAREKIDIVVHLIFANVSDGGNPDLYKMM
jgi:hypothetical protein